MNTPSKATLLMIALIIVSGSLFTQTPEEEAMIAQARELESDADMPITLERLSIDRINDARAYYTKRMNHVRWTINGTAAAIGISGLAFLIYRMVKSDNGFSDDAKGLTIDDRNRLKDIEKSIQMLDKEKDAAKVSVLQLQYDLLKDKQKMKQQAESDSTSFFKSPVTAPLKIGAMLGVAGVVLTAGQHFLRVVSGTLEDAFKMWWYGYKYWYLSIEHRVKNQFIELQESLNKARKLEQSGHDTLALTRQLRYAPQGTVMDTHYRADITVQYHVSLGLLERLVGLMYIRAPQENHTVISRYVQKLSGIIARLADKLEYDLNQNTHGTLTHYSNETFELFYKVHENVKLLLNTYNVYLRRS